MTGFIAAMGALTIYALGKTFFWPTMLGVVAEQYRAMRTLVDEMVFDVYVEQEAKKSGRPVQERFGKDFRSIFKQRDATETLPTQIAGEGA